MTGTETDNWTFHHLGVIVFDLAKTVDYYKSLGFVDFPPARPGAPSGPVWTEFTAYGKTAIKDGKPLVAPKPGAKPSALQFCRIGTITLEVIQPGEGGVRNIHNDFLAEYGEGIDHIAYTVAAENFDAEVEKMKAKGLPVILSGEQANGGGFIYFDAREVGGLIVELMRVPPPAK